MLALVAVVPFAAVASLQFATPQNLLNIVRQVSVIGIVALGMTLVIIVGGIDLSVGAVLALSGGAALWTLGLTDQPWLGVAAGLATGLLAGAVNGLLVTWGRLPSFIATLGMLAAARSLILYIADGGSARTTTRHTATSRTRSGSASRPPIWFFRPHRAGAARRDETLGVRPLRLRSGQQRTRLAAVGPAGGRRQVRRLHAVRRASRAGRGARVVAPQLACRRPTRASPTELDAIAAVIIGGTRMSGGRGKIIGTVIGVLILGILNNALNLMNVSPYLQGMVKGLIIVLAVLVQKGLIP